jgi:hypothetical protein
MLAISRVQVEIEQALRDGFGRAIFTRATRALPIEHTALALIETIVRSSPLMTTCRDHEDLQHRACARLMLRVDS